MAPEDDEAEDDGGAVDEVLLAVVDVAVNCRHLSQSPLLMALPPEEEVVMETTAVPTSQ